MRSRARRIFTIALFLFAAALGVTCTTAFILWRTHAIERWVDKKVATLYAQRIEGHIPFEITDVVVERHWKDLLKGKIGNLGFTLKRDDWKARFDGALSFPLSLKEGRFDYFPKVTIQNPGKDSFTPLFLHVWMEGSPEREEIQKIGIETAAETEKAPFVCRHERKEVHIDKPKVAIEWAARKLSLAVRGDALSFTSPDQTINIKLPRIDATLDLSLKPFQAGPDWKAKASLQGVEMLLGTRYFSLNEPDVSDILEAAASGTVDPSTNIATADVEIAPKTKHPLHLQAKLGKEGQLRFKINDLPIAAALRGFLNSTSSAGPPFSDFFPLKSMAITSGTLSLEGEAQARNRYEGILKIKDLSFSWPSKNLAMNDLNIRVPLSSSKGIIGGEIAVRRFGYRKILGSLKETPFSSSYSAPDAMTVRFGEKGRKIPLSLEGMGLSIDSVSGGVLLSKKTFSLETGASLEPLGIDQVLGSLCAVEPGTKLPPVTVHANYPKIEVTDQGIDFTGSARAELFGGFVEISDASIYDYREEVPEFDFTATMDRVRLDQLGSWANFGDMDGILTGLAKDVVFQSWLPTQYDLLVQVKPLNHGTVVFSPEAMKNFARLFAHEAIDQLPGIAQWAAFGWPSHFLGGYDIDYAGAHVTSPEGPILLKTLDPALDIDPLTREDSRHYVLFGRRFKMPLNSVQYPLVLDAAAMGNFVHQMIGEISSLAKKHKDDKSEYNEEIPHVPDDPDSKIDAPKACTPVL